MKTYEVELKRTSYITVTVDAENAEQAEELAWHELDNQTFLNKDDANWEVESIEEMVSDEARANGPHHKGETA